MNLDGIRLPGTMFFDKFKGDSILEGPGCSSSSKSVECRGGGGGGGGIWRVFEIDFKCFLMIESVNGT